jgi:mitochondrial protein import protein ZIM17
MLQRAYNEGLVIVRCYGCDNHHLIADRLNWFEEGNVDVHDLITKYGTAENSTDVSNVSVQLSKEDIAVLQREIVDKARALAQAQAEERPEQ